MFYQATSLHDTLGSWNEKLYWEARPKLAACPGVTQKQMDVLFPPLGLPSAKVIVNPALVNL